MSLSESLRAMSLGLKRSRKHQSAALSYEHPSFSSTQHCSRQQAAASSRGGGPLSQHGQGSTLGSYSGILIKLH